MRVSIVVITRNEERNISLCLDALLAQKYTQPFEIVVADGQSTDATPKIVKSYSKRHKNVRFFTDKGRFQNSSRNVGVRKANYEFIAFTDADCIPPKDWLNNLARKYCSYEKTVPHLAGVGGANIPLAEKDDFTTAIGIAFNSFLGSLGSIQAKPLKKDGQVFSLSCTNCLFEKKALFHVGLFPTYAGNMGDDWILGLLLKKKGYVLMGLKDSFVWHKFRPTPIKFWKNMVLYGRVRMGFLKKQFSDNNPLYLLPLAFGIVIASSLLAIWNPLFFIPLLYFPGTLIYAIILSAKAKKLHLSGQVFLVFLLLHFGYCVGEYRGIVR
ncbi:MAG: glycosyltransferase [archaeon]